MPEATISKNVSCCKCIGEEGNWSYRLRVGRGCRVQFPPCPNFFFTMPYQNNEKGKSVMIALLLKPKNSTLLPSLNAFFLKSGQIHSQMEHIICSRHRARLGVQGMCQDYSLVREINGHAGFSTDWWVHQERQLIIIIAGTSLVVLWLRIYLPMQRTQVWSLVLEDSTCRRATMFMPHSYWACA